MSKKANSIAVFSMKALQMPSLHVMWVTFLSCLFALFACAPLMQATQRQTGFSVAPAWAQHKGVLLFLLMVIAAAAARFLGEFNRDIQEARSHR